MNKKLTLFSLLAICVLIVGLAGCGGKKQPEMIQGMTVDGLPPLTGELAEKVKCTDESYAATCADASTGIEHCKFMMRRNAEQALMRGLTETLMSTTDEGGRVSTTLDSELEIARSFIAKNAIHMQLAKHESNVFTQTSSKGDQVWMRVCVIIDDVAPHYYRSLEEKAMASDPPRESVAEFAETMLDKVYKQGVANQDKVKKTTQELQDHFAYLYNSAFDQMAKQKR
jgi:hypothetical protein